MIVTRFSRTTLIATAVAFVGLLGAQVIHPAVARAADPVIAAAGDIACDPASSSFNGGNGTATNCRAKYTAALLSANFYSAVLPMGDEQYECGGLSTFQQSYDLSWGEPNLLALSRPVPGNHEYESSGGTDCGGSAAAGYFGTFGALAHPESRGYYSYDIGTWHLIALNSQCTFVPCKKGSAQELWLNADLAAHSNTCVLAYWHDPRFASRSSGAVPTKTLPWWNDLYAARADIILGASFHVYERFAMLDPSGNIDADHGIREFVTGMGGKSHGGSLAQMPGSVIRDRTHYGILQLTLHETSYDWSFLGEDGSNVDGGSGNCVT